MECKTNSHCKFDQLCDTSSNTCKASFQEPEPQIDPDKYQIDKYKGKSLKKLETSPEIQQKYKEQSPQPQIEQKYIEQNNVNPKNALPKDVYQKK